MCEAHLFPIREKSELMIRDDIFWFFLWYTLSFWIGWDWKRRVIWDLPERAQARPELDNLVTSICLHDHNRSRQNDCSDCFLFSMSWVWKKIQHPDLEILYLLRCESWRYSFRRYCRSSLENSWYNTIRSDRRHRATRILFFRISYTIALFTIICNAFAVFRIFHGRWESLSCERVFLGEKRELHLRRY